MQHIKVIIHEIAVAPGISIIFKEGNGSIIQRDFLIEVQGEHNKQYKSLYYVEKFPIYEKREIISKWLNGNLSNEELRKSI